MDYYLENPDRLEGQPKRTIADYVEQEGIIAPRRFNNLAEARASGLPLIARSEHPQEYNGASGILESHYLQGRPTFLYEQLNHVQTEGELKAMVLAEREGGTSMHRQFCKLTGQDEKRFREEVTFSFWELLKGFNRAVVADSSIPGRHHVITYKRYREGQYHINYSIVDDRQVSREFVDELLPELKEGLHGLVEVYEKVRHLGRFDTNHCPIMEFQTVDGRDYFLQYHRTRDFEPAEFTLDRKLKDGEIEVPFVRGATQKGGMECKVTVHYAKNLGGVFDPQNEDGSWDCYPIMSYVFSELQTRQRMLQMIGNNSKRRNNLDRVMHDAVEGHLQKSKLFKPKVSVIAKIDDFFFDGEGIHDFYERARNGQNSYMTLHVVSDGRKAYTRRI